MSKTKVRKRDVAKAFAPLGGVIVFAVGLGLHIRNKIAK